MYVPSGVCGVCVAGTVQAQWKIRQSMSDAYQSVKKGGGGILEGTPKTRYTRCVYLYVVGGMHTIGALRQLIKEPGNLISMNSIINLDRIGRQADPYQGYSQRELRCSTQYCDLAALNIEDRIIIGTTIHLEKCNVQCTKHSITTGY